MRKYTLITLFFTMELWGMCRFPHNPGVYCVKANVNNLKKYTKSKVYKCVGDLNIEQIFRPKNTYKYNKNLELVKFDKDQKLSQESFKSNKKIYAHDCDEFNSEFYLVELSCYDTNPEFDDYSFLVHGKTRVNITDPWTQKDVAINCTFLKEQAI